jgi:hypothetical protein
MPTSRRSTCSGRWRIRGCNRGTHSRSSGWRRRDCRSSNYVRLIRSMLAIISKFYFCLEVDDALNVGSIDHILCPMIEHVHDLSPKESTEAQRRLIIKNS